MSERPSQFTKVIECSCKSDGVLVSGIEFDAFLGDSDTPVAYCYLDFWERCPYEASRGSLWKRIKRAWKYLTGQRFVVQDIVLLEDGVKDLRDICDEILELWPDEAQQRAWREKKPLREIYQEMKKDEKLLKEFEKNRDDFLKWKDEKR